MKTRWSEKRPGLGTRPATQGRCRRLGVSAVLALATGLSFGGDEVIRLSVDLDADGKAESVSMSTTPKDKDGIGQFILRANSASYADSYYAEDGGGVSELRAVALDRKRPQRQLFVAVREPASCAFHLLAYSAGKLMRLLKFDSDAGCAAPTISGNGEVEVSTWQGFWSKKELYRLTPDGNALVLQARTLCEVQQSGSAATKLTLKGAMCREQTVAEGAPLSVTRFDSEQDRYLLKTESGACGWVPAREINRAVSGLRWAG